MTWRVAVVGAGVAGLAAALRLRDRLGPRAAITVWDKDDIPGGKLRTATVGGVRTELGAEMFLARDPEGDGESAAVALARRLGLDLVHPAPVPPALVVDGRLRPFPPGTLLGVPGEPERLPPVAIPQPERDRDEGRPVLGPDEDVAVGALVRRRLGDQVVDRLVDPMLGGVYAGRADTLSLAATMPALAAACRTEPTLTGAVRTALATARHRRAVPVFATVRDGVGRLVEAMAAVSHARLRLGRPVRELSRTGTGTGTGWRLVAGSTRDPEPVEVDAVVLALPARPAARLLRGVDPHAGDLMGELDYASVGLITLVLPAGTRLPERSGLLVPASEQMTIKAATFLTRKWPHLAGDRDPVVVVRASVGRYGEEQVLQHADPELVRLARADLSTILGEPLPAPLATHVQRWGGALPQYAPGHLDRVAGARAALPATLGLAGAGYDGVGIPACVRSGQRAADGVADALEESVT
jgi:protoporphyrinogen/coproporphyrinogen III oxidase